MTDSSVVATLSTAEALRVSEEKFSKAFRISPELILISSVAEGRCLDVNDSLLRRTGYAREEIIGRTTRELNLWVSPPRDVMVQLLKTHGFVRDLEVEYRCKSGETGFVLMYVEPITIGNEACLIAIGHDITAQKRIDAERERLHQELERQVRLLDTILSTTPDHFHVHDREGRYLYASPIALQAVGLTADQVVGRNWRDLGFPADEGRRFEQRLKIVFDTGQTVRAELALPTGDDLHYYEQILSPLYDQSGQVAMAVSTVHDITERKRTEQLIEQYANEVLARNEDLEAFSHTVAHDLKGPLSNIIGFIRWLQDHPDFPQADRQTYIDVIARNATKMDAIIDELLLLAQVRKEQVELLPIDTARLIAEAQARLGSMIAESGVVIRVPGDWPAALGYGPWVEEVWVNYLSNAMKYGRTPGVPFRIELGFDEQHERFIRFWVRDWGPGIPEEAQADLFTAFGEHSKVRATGHGLGLSIVRMIVAKMGGQVGVESAPGRGSKFYFTLPTLE
jgi:PAS domain S-box-containing protein